MRLLALSSAALLAASLVLASESTEPARETEAIGSSETAPVAPVPSEPTVAPLIQTLPPVVVPTDYEYSEAPEVLARAFEDEKWDEARALVAVQRYELIGAAFDYLKEHALWTKMPYVLPAGRWTLRLLIDQVPNDTIFDQLLQSMTFADEELEVGMTTAEYAEHPDRFVKVLVKAQKDDWPRLVRETLKRRSAQFFEALLEQMEASPRIPHAIESVAISYFFESQAKQQTDDSLEALRTYYAHPAVDVHAYGRALAKALRADSSSRHSAFLIAHAGKAEIDAALAQLSPDYHDHGARNALQAARPEAPDGSPRLQTHYERAETTKEGLAEAHEEMEGVENVLDLIGKYTVGGSEE